MDESEHGELLGKAFEYQLALVSNPRTSADDFTKTQKEAKGLFEDIEGAIRPWLGRSKEDRQSNEADDFKIMWEELAGFNPDDKEALDKWSEEISKHTNAAAETRAAAEASEATRQSSFQARLEAIRLKRLRQQQGRN